MGRRDSTLAHTHIDEILITVESVHYRVGGKQYTYDVCVVLCLSAAGQLCVVVVDVVVVVRRHECGDPVKSVWWLVECVNACTMCT